MANTLLTGEKSAYCTLLRCCFPHDNILMNPQTGFTEVDKALVFDSP